MRILVVNYEYPPIGGGGGFVTRDISERMVESGSEVTVITSKYGDLMSKENVNGVEVLRVPVMYRNKMEIASIASLVSYVPSSILKAFCAVNGNRYDIINTHFAVPSGPAGYVLSKIFQIPNVLSIHGGDIFNPDHCLSPHRIPIIFSTVCAMISKADRVIAQSSDTKTNAIHYYKIKRDIDIIPLGIKKPSFQRKTRQDFGLGPDETVLCTIGRLIPRKDIVSSLYVLSELKNKFKFKFLIIGEGTERSNIEKMIKLLGLTERVLMLGNASDEEKFQLLDLSDIYISTAKHEGFGLVFLEAMECGLPVISYNCGGQTDFLVNGETGFLVQLNDREAFGKRLVELLTDRQHAEKISDYNRELVKSYYISICAEKYLSLFEKVLSSHSK